MNSDELISFLVRHNCTGTYVSKLLGLAPRTIYRYIKTNKTPIWLNLALLGLEQKFKDNNQ